MFQLSQIIVPASFNPRSREPDRYLSLSRESEAPVVPFQASDCAKWKQNTKMDMKANNDFNLPDVPQLPSNSDPGSWKLWLVGVFMTVIIPFWRNKWSPLQKLQQKVEQVVDTAQAVTDMVDDVVEEIEKVADEIGDRLPEGKLRDSAQYVEDLANKTSESIDRLEDVLDKVEEVENKLEDFLEEQQTKEGNKKEGKNDEKKTQTKAEKSVTST